MIKYLKFADLSAKRVSFEVVFTVITSITKRTKPTEIIIFRLLKPGIFT